MENFRKSKQYGFTLIEMIVAFAVLGIATLGIGGFFVTSARSYSTVSAESSLQHEAQLALNQVENMLIDSTLGVSYNYVTNESDPASGYHFVKSDSEASGVGAAVSKVLYAFNVDENDGSKFKVLLLKWVAADEAVYYKEMSQTQGAGATVSAIDISGNTQEEGWDLLAEGIKEFSVDLSKYEKTKKVEISLLVSKREKEYQATGTITLRNNVLINEDSIDKIYENINKIVKSEITGVNLTANPDVTVPGGVVQLKAKVVGTGYPSQEIYRWLVASTSDMKEDSIIYDSLKGKTSESQTWIDAQEQTLMVSPLMDGEGSTFHEMLWVQVIVDTGKLDGEGNPIYVSAIKSVAVKLISNIEVSYAIPNVTGNENFPPQVAKTATLQAQRSNPSDIPSVSMNPGNIIDMKATVTGSDTLNSDDKEITWSIVDKPETVIADIDASGRLEINKYSQTGSFTVRAALRLEKNVYVDYLVIVGTQYDENNAKLQIIAPSDQVNRGGHVDCSLLLNDIEVDVEDYNWSVTVSSSSSQSLVGTPVTVNNQGGLYVNNDLSYDYNYRATVKAELKSNPSIFAVKTFTIPKVSLSITPKVKFAKMGNTVTGITCKAIGLESYDITWSMAKDTNPNYFFTAFGNSNITGSKNADGTGAATVKLGSNEPQTNVTVKATLKGNANYYTTMQIRTSDASMSIKGANTVSRGETIALSITTNPSDIGVTEKTVKWEITSVKAGGTNISSDGLTISEGKLTVAAGFAPNYLDQNITITVKASEESIGISATYTVTIAKFGISILPDKPLLIPDGSSATIQYTALVNGYNDNNLKWSVTTNYNSNKVTINSSTGLLTAQQNSLSASDNMTWTVKASVENVSESVKLRYGFENVSSYTIFLDEKYSADRWYRYNWNGSRSQYYVLSADGTLCPVCYIQYTEQRWSNRKYENVKSESYAFVSDSASINGSGTWYQYTQQWGYSSQWEEISSAPSGWDSSWFDEF